MKFILFLTIIPFFSFCQSSQKSITGKWCGNYIITNVTYPDGIKIKDTLIVHDTTKAVFIFKQNNTGKLTYTSNSKDFEKVPPFIFSFKILPGSIIKFFNKNGTICSRFYLKNNSLGFQPYPVSNAFKESIELFYDIKYERSNL